MYQEELDLIKKTFTAFRNSEVTKEELQGKHFEMVCNLPPIDSVHVDARTYQNQDEEISFILSAVNDLEEFEPESEYDTVETDMATDLAIRLDTFFKRL